MARNDGSAAALETGTAPETGTNGAGPAVQLYTESGVKPAKTDAAYEDPSFTEATTEPVKTSRRLWRWILLSVVAAIGTVGGVSYYVYSLSYESTDDAFIEAHVIAVSPRIAGHVAAVYVDDNQWVAKGEPVAELDPRDFEARLAAAEAALAAARAGRISRSMGADVTQITSTAGVDEASAAVEGASAAVATARAVVATAQAGLEQARADLLAAMAKQQRAEGFLKRVRTLVPEHAASQDTLDEAVAADKVAQAEVSVVRQRIAAQEAAVRQAESGVAAQLAALGRAKALEVAAKSAPKQIAQSRSQTTVAEAEVARAEAEVTQARLNLSYTKIYAPISGRVTRKSVEIGTHVQIGQPLLALVDPDVWVIANFKETQLAQMQPGQPVVVSIDTRPGVKLAAHVDSVQSGSGARFSLLPPENATGNYVKVVQRVPVKILFDDLTQIEHYGLGPGMSVVPTVKIDEPGRASGAATRTASR